MYILNTYTTAVTLQLIFFRFQGCYITGLYLEGAIWDVNKRCLTECTSNSSLGKLPILAIVPVEKRLLKSPKSSITIPVYVTSKRRNFVDNNCVFEANLNTLIHKSFWILKGVCVVMNLEQMYNSFLNVIINFLFQCNIILI